MSDENIFDSLKDFKLDYLVDHTNDKPMPFSSGILGVKHSEETKRKIGEGNSKALKGVPKKPRSKSHCENISKSKKGVAFSDEHKNSLKIARKDRVFTEETRKKMSESRKNKTFSEETRKKISEKAKARFAAKKQSTN